MSGRNYFHSFQNNICSSQDQWLQSKGSWAPTSSGETPGVQPLQAFICVTEPGSHVFVRVCVPPLSSKKSHDIHVGTWRRHCIAPRSTHHIEPPTHAAGNDGILLVLQPTDNPQDPLNWCFARKLRLLFIICLAAFAGNVAALAGQEAYPVQSKVYKVTILEFSYSVCPAVQLAQFFSCR